MEDNLFKNIDASFKMENLSIDNNTKILINNYFDGKFTSDQIIDTVKSQYSNLKEF